MAATTTTSLHTLSFDAASLLGLDTYSHCVGYAPSTNRRCYNPISKADQANACRRFRTLPHLANDPAALYDEVEELAHLCLCKRNHQSQIGVVAGMWVNAIQADFDRQRQRHARRAPQPVSTPSPAPQTGRQRLHPAANSLWEITLPTAQDVRSTTVASLANRNAAALDALIKSLESIRAVILAAQAQQSPPSAVSTHAVAQETSSAGRAATASATADTGGLPRTGTASSPAVTAPRPVQASAVPMTTIRLRSTQTNTTAVSIIPPLPTSAVPAARIAQTLAPPPPAAQIPATVPPARTHAQATTLARSPSSPTPQRHIIPFNQHCAICLDRHTDPVRTPCGHFYCRECITTWLSNHSTCPEDRRRLSTTQLTPVRLLRRRSVEGECPICYEEIEGGEGQREEGTVFCRAGCGQNFHAACFGRWRQASGENGGGESGVVRCPFCRMRWED